MTCRFHGNFYNKIIPGYQPCQLVKRWKKPTFQGSVPLRRGQRWSSKLWFFFASKPIDTGGSLGIFYYTKKESLLRVSVRGKSKSCDRRGRRCRQCFSPKYFCPHIQPLNVAYG
jgi:hypothetical protein